jgi:hypothetical protein
MILSVLYKTNKFSWIFIMLVHRKQQSTSKHVAQLWHIIVISSQPVKKQQIPTLYLPSTTLKL